MPSGFIESSLELKLRTEFKLLKRELIAVYIMANSRRTLYIGVTNHLLRRVHEHKFGEVEGYVKRYNLTKLVHYEQFASMRDAIAREKQLKGWLRAKKVALIEDSNPGWLDLAVNWYARDSSQAQDDGNLI